MSVSGIVPPLAASYQPASAGGRASVNGMTGAAELGSVGPAAVLELSRNATRLPLIQTISQILRQEFERSALDLAA